MTPDESVSATRIDPPAAADDVGPVAEGTGSAQTSQNDESRLGSSRSGSVLGLSLAVSVLLTLLFWLPEVMRWLLPKYAGVIWQRFHEAPDAMLLRKSLETLSLLWFFLLGGSFGSFLHCVVYRVPRKISVVASGSRCPGCGTKIRAWHNVPVFGWLWLRGRCAACGWGIPVRYPAAEFLFGLVFVLLLVPEIIMGGWNLPGRQPPFLFSVSEMLWSPQAPLLQTYVYHAGLMTFLLTACLFAVDRIPLPRVVAVLGLFFVLIFPAVWGYVIRVGLLGEPLSAVQSNVPAWLIPLPGAAAGMLAGVVMLRRRAGNLLAGDESSILFAMTLAGAALGWQAAMTIGVGAMLLRFLFAMVPWKSGILRTPQVFLMTPVTLAYMLCWRLLVERARLADESSQLLLQCSLPAVLMLASHLLDLLEARSARPA